MKKSLALILAMLLIAALCACGNTTPAAPADETPAVEAPAQDEYPLHEEYRDEAGNLLWESVTDRSDSGFTMTTTFYNTSGVVIGVQEDTLDSEMVLLSSRALSPGGALLSDWSVETDEDGTVEHLSYYDESGTVKATMDRRYNDMAIETGNSTSSWFGFMRETFAAPTPEEPDRMYTRAELNLTYTENGGSFTCYAQPQYMSEAYAYTRQNDGNIKVTYTVYGDQSNQVACTETWLFDKDAALLSKKVEWPDGLVSESTFDGDQEVVTLTDADGSRTLYLTDTRTGLRSETIFQDAQGVTYLQQKLDANGNVAEDLYFFEGQPHGRTLYTYDEQGRPVRTETYSPDDTREGATATTYDDQGQVLRTEHFDSKDELIDYSERSYDENGILLGETFFSPDGTMTEKFEYTIDENGVRTGFAHYGADGQLIEQGTY